MYSQVHYPVKGSSWRNSAKFFYFVLHFFIRWDVSILGFGLVWIVCPAIGCFQVALGITLHVHSHPLVRKYRCTFLVMCKQKPCFEEEAGLNSERPTGLIHTAAILSRETEKALFYQPRPRSETCGSEARQVRQSYFILLRQNGCCVIKACWLTKLVQLSQWMRGKT